MSKDDYTTKSISLLEKAGDSRGLHGAGGWRARRAITSSPKSMRSRNMWRTAGARMFLLDPPLKIGRPTADNDALDNVLQGWGVSVEKICCWT